MSKIVIILLSLNIFVNCLEPRIAGGFIAKWKKYKYLAHIALLDENKKVLGTCTGFLLTQEIVITAAHCLPRNLKESLSVLLGNSKSIFLEKTGTPFDTYNVKRYVRHKGYTQNEKGLGINDIALLFLENKVKLNPNIKFGRLSRKHIKDGQTCIAVGWGKIDTRVRFNPEKNNFEITNEENPDGLLREVKVEVVKSTTCARDDEIPFYENDVFLMTNNLVDGVIFGALEGDSGGPLVCDGAISGVFSQVIRKGGEIDDVTQFTVVCGLYMRVEKYIGWIEYVDNGTNLRRMAYWKKSEEHEISNIQHRSLSFAVCVYFNLKFYILGFLYVTVNY